MPDRRPAASAAGDEADSAKRVSKQASADARKAALIHHTREQMLLYGFSNVSLSEILRLAGGSKATMAKYFGNKAGLLAAALAESAKETVLQLTLRQGAGDDLLTAITDLISGLLEFYLSPNALATYRGVIAAAGTAESMADVFYTNGQNVVVAEVAGFLERWRGRGIREDVDLLAEAGRLTHLIRANMYEQVLLGIANPAPDRAQIELVAADCAALFVHGIGAGLGQPAAR